MELCGTEEHLAEVVRGAQQLRAQRAVVPRFRSRRQNLLYLPRRRRIAGEKARRTGWIPGQQDFTRDDHHRSCDRRIALHQAAVRKAADANGIPVDTVTEVPVTLSPN